MTAAATHVSIRVHLRLRFREWILAVADYPETEKGAVQVEMITRGMRISTLKVI